MKQKYLHMDIINVPFQCGGFLNYVPACLIIPSPCRKEIEEIVMVF